MIPYTLIAPIVVEVLVLVAIHVFAIKTRLSPLPGSMATVIVGTAITIVVFVHEATQYVIGEPVSMSLGFGAVIALVASLIAAYGIDWLGILTDPKLQHQKAR